MASSLLCPPERKTMPGRPPARCAAGSAGSARRPPQRPPDGRSPCRIRPCLASRACPPKPLADRRARRNVVQRLRRHLLACVDVVRAVHQHLRLDYRAPAPSPDTARRSDRGRGRPEAGPRWNAVADRDYCPPLGEPGAKPGCIPRSRSRSPSRPSVTVSPGQPASRLDAGVDFNAGDDVAVL